MPKTYLIFLQIRITLLEIIFKSLIFTAWNPKTNVLDLLTIYNLKFYLRWPLLVKTVKHASLLFITTVSLHEFSANML